MRTTSQKLSLAFVALLLAHCALPGESEPSASDKSAATLGDSFDTGGALTPIHASGALGATLRTRSADPGADAIAYLKDLAESAGVAGPDFKVRSVVTGNDSLTHVRVMQVFKGIEVLGGDAVVHMSSGSVLGAAGNVAGGLEKTGTQARLSSADAISMAKADRFGADVVTSREESTQIIFVREDGTPVLAYHTAFFNELQGDVQPAFWNHIYDANSGELLARWNNLHTANEQASGPGGNPKWVHSWSSELDVSPKADKFVLTTTATKTLDFKQRTSGGTEVLGTLESIGDAPINDAHGFAEITLRVLDEWMGHNSINDNGFQIVSRVHYDRNYENAFWDGQQMTYGDGANTFYPLSGGLDVVAHEIHHGFTTFHSNLRYSGQSGGLNEGFSDIAGKTAEFYYKPVANWDLGGDVFKKPNAALRYMCDPKKDGRSIDKATSFTNGLDPHYSSGVPNKAFCLSSKRFSAAGNAAGEATRDGVKRAATAFYLANANYWTTGTTYVQGCQGILDAARALNYTAEEISWLKASWADVAVTCN